MNICRICLNQQPEKDIYNIKVTKKMNNKSFLEIILFCLDIQILQDSKVSSMLCMKCYRKVLSFHKFKCLALKNDWHLKSVAAEMDVKNEVLIPDDIKCEEASVSGEDTLNNDVNLEEECIKTEGTPNFESEDELLSVIKDLKYELGSEEHNENQNVKKKIGRPKKIKIDTPKTYQICDECGKSVRCLKSHMNQHLPPHERKRLKCDVCDKTFTCYNAKYKHYRRKHLNIKYHCKVCNKSVLNLKQHTVVVHNKAALPHRCVPCGRRFVTRSSLQLHMTSHTKDRPYECEHCRNKYRSKFALLLHIRCVHNKEKTHLCQFCSKSFFKKYHLQVHLRTHTKEKPYKCPDCGKFYSSTTTLKNHRLIHNDSKMFHCTLCDTSFSTPNYLRAHMISHVKEKRYPCHYCDVKFHRSDHRKRHEFTAHEKHLAKS